MMYRAGQWENNFGFLRLLLATMVIVSHSPQILDGNRSHEILVRIFGTLSLGDFAVYGFFLISGYLITKSFLQSRSIFSYLKKRILRIFPGFLVSFWICVLLVAPFAGASGRVFSARVLSLQLHNSLMLVPPQIEGVFPGMSATLNASMWTIAYEFACYILAMVPGILGLYSQRFRPFFLVTVSLLFLGDVFNVLADFHSLPVLYVPFLKTLIRLEAVFGIGALCYIYRDKVRFTRRGALASAIMLFFLLFSREWAATSMAIFGGYLIFYIAFELPVHPISQFMGKIDLSYGMYLYAWPIASVIAWRYRHIHPWLLSAITFVCSALVAYLSWTFVEKPSLALVRKERRVSVFAMQAEA
jgi:peptidoglycan/LPS O-acetylase OafA/YrhL